MGFSITMLAVLAGSANAFTSVQMKTIWISIVLLSNEICHVAIACVFHRHFSDFHMLLRVENNSKFLIVSGNP